MFLESKKNRMLDDRFFLMPFRGKYIGRVSDCLLPKLNQKHLSTATDDARSNCLCIALSEIFMYCKEENFYLQPPGPQTAPKEPPVGPAIPNGLI